MILREDDSAAGFIVEQRLAERTPPVAEGAGMVFAVPTQPDARAEATFVFVESLPTPSRQRENLNCPVLRPATISFPGMSETRGADAIGFVIPAKAERSRGTSNSAGGGGAELPQKWQRKTIARQKRAARPTWQSGFAR
jgi:hypothetical protein